MGVNQAPLPNGIKLVNTGLVPDDFLGDPLPVAFQKINDNFRLTLTANDSLLPGNVTFNGPVIFPQQVTFQGSVVIDSTGSLTVNGNTLLTGSTTVSGSIRFTGLSTFDGSAVFNGLTSIKGPLVVDGNSTFNSLTRFNGPVEFTDTVSLPPLDVNIGRDELLATNPGPRRVLTLNNTGLSMEWSLLREYHFDTPTPPRIGQVLGFNGNTLVWRDPMPVLNYVVEGETHNSVKTELFVEGSCASAPVRMTIPEDTTWAFHIVLAGRTVNSNNESAGFEFKGVIDNNTGTVDLVGQPIKLQLAQDTQEWDANVLADNVHNALIVQVIGEDNKVISWRAVATIAPVS